MESTIYGDIQGIRKSMVEQLESLYQYVIPSYQVITAELLHHMALLTEQIKREIAIYINRHGQVSHVAVGNCNTVSLPEITSRRSFNRLSGIRCIHTHPVNDSTLSALDVTSLKDMRFDLMAAIAILDGKAAEASFAYISGFTNDAFDVQTIGPLPIDEFTQLDFPYLTAQIERQIEAIAKPSELNQTERAILVGIDCQGGWDIRDSLEELTQLTQTAGAEVVEVVFQKRDKPDAALYIGKGKVQEIAHIRQMKDANLIIFDDELSPAQQRNLERELGIKVLDRTALILDIFAQRAHSYEGKLQVELAQLRYNLPRLGGQGLVLSRLGGGIGTRGPGETKLEVDRRRIRSRISDIEQAINQIKKQRDVRRERRQNTHIISIALVGYTNAGKSTLLNKITDANVLAEDKLFATLDPTTRRIMLPNGQEALLTDTVGFIQKLPHQLVAAFRATLEEVVQADLLLHVIDASHPRFQEQMGAVIKVLRELKVDEKETILVFNKIDNLTSQHQLERLERLENSIAISAKSGSGIENLLNLLEGFSSRQLLAMRLLIPYSDSGLLSFLYDHTMVQKLDYREEGIEVRTMVPAEFVSRCQSYILGDD